MADNYADYGEKLKELVQEFVTHPLCINHFELDVQWSLINFLLDVSKNPVAALAENKNSIKLEDLNVEDEIEPDRRRSFAMHELVNSLIQNNIPIVRDGATKPKATDDDSDLSVSGQNLLKSPILCILLTIIVLRFL